jgi:DNA-directed RNA polymerase specialized sigma24 family protein
MAVRQKRGSRLAGGVSATVRGEDGQPVAASVDGLLARVAHGDAEAFAALYDQVADAVHGLMSRIVGDQSRAEQLTADALVEVWRSASQFSPAESSGTGWVMAVARRRAAAERAAGSQPADRCLASMPGPQREAVLLAYCGYTWRQAADRAGVPPERLREGSPGPAASVAYTFPACGVTSGVVRPDWAGTSLPPIRR